MAARRIWKLCARSARARRTGRASRRSARCWLARGDRLAGAKKPGRDERHRTGQTGEATARRELSRLGYEVLDANYRTRDGEVDLIAREGRQYVFIEVRTLLASRFGLPEESITPAKQQRIVKVAQAYLQEHGADGADWRIDVVVVVQGGIRVHRNAVSEPEAQ